MSGIEIEIVLDPDLVKIYMLEGLNLELVTYLNNSFKIIPNATGRPSRFKVQRETIELLSIILATTKSSIIVKQVFKSLRNCVVLGSSEIVEWVFNNDYILSYVGKLLSRPDESTKIILQFLVNIIVKKKDTALKISHLIKDCIILLLQNEDVSYYAGAMLYNILRLHSNECFPVELYNIVLGLCTSKPEANEYYIFLLDLFLLDANFFAALDTIETSRRVMLFNYIIDNNKYDFHDDIIKQLSLQFKKQSDCILRTVTSDVDQIEPEEVVLLLEILGLLSARDRHIRFIQSDKSLLINAVFLLKSIHSIGKDSLNSFTPIEKLSNADDADTHPMFGFKGNLIKLIGNMCCKHIDNQNQVRELDGIPILLDCCNIDARNPYITQWCILAIHNLCENNLENQSIIAGMSRQGMVDSSTLQKMGLTLHADGGNKIGIVPLDVLKCDKS